MRTSGITKKRPLRAGWIFTLLLAFLASAMLIRAALAAARGEVTLTVRQVFTAIGPSAPPSQTFRYRLTPKQAGNPMPAIRDAGEYAFTITGTRAAQIGPIQFTSAGTYAYEISSITGSQPGYSYDQKAYSLDIIVESDLTSAVVVYTEDGNKAENIAYEHSYNRDEGLAPSDPSLMTDPPVVKTVSGSPATASVFTFRLTAGNPSNPMPAHSENGVKTMQLNGSGRAEFGTWAYTAEGIYYYTVSEVNTGSSDYTYDTSVYTITDTVSASNGQLRLTRVVTNNANKQVASLSFINTYKGGVTGGGPNGSGGPNNSGNTPDSGPKTGDESQTPLYMALFCSAGAAALGSAGYLLAGTRRGKGNRYEA